MKKVFLLPILLGFILWNGCDSSEKSFDRSEILEQVASALILPSYKKLDTELKSLQLSATAFNQNPSTSTLANLKSSLQKARLAWATSETFNFGPVDQLALATQVNFWPVNTIGIEEEITNYDPTKDYKSLLASNKKGFSAIEYLLYQEEEAVTIAAFNNSSRQGLLTFFVEDLLRISTEIHSAWLDNYNQTFITSTGSDVNSSATILANELIMLSEQIKNKKLGEPLGLVSTITADPSIVEAYYAKQSLALIKTNLETMKQTFNGTDGSGFDDFLNALDITYEGQEPLSSTINSQFDKCLTAVAAINGSLQEAINSDASHTEDLYDEMRALIVLLKSDMMSQLSLTVVPGDNDGD
ncbi:imelysin family protein [Reichenbachiella carrageenanivorans]|uniref:Imelysin family protein n=1 Tax=Reichenbachiella carrageenanivorans TaxID=2979869 RepID=A0ABY6D1U2_9BACT|nr:imelysin family protein [Reichenbachiella carrageenanivorans]UXX80127.1 imelysin family protein [Reichenbachiella carrageenanivorans]